MLHAIFKLKSFYSKSPLPPIKYISGPNIVGKSLQSTVDSPNFRETLPNNNAGRIERVGIDRFIETCRTNTLLLKPDERIKTFDKLWSLIIADDNVNIMTINRYLLARIDGGLEVNAEEILNVLRERGITANSRTYSALVHQTCSKGEMENTGLLLRSMKEAGVRPGADLFCEILYGYVKSGYPEEVASTKQILGRMGLWPSTIAYKAMMNAYAELGDRQNLISVLTEALDHQNNKIQSIGTSQHQVATIPPLFLVQLYVKLLCAESPRGGTCSEILSQLPPDLDVLCVTRGRDGVKQLLAHGQLNAALELFKCIDPKSADDRFLVSLVRYMEIGNLKPEESVRIWSAAEVSGPRRNVLKRDINFLNRRPAPDQTVYSNLFKDFPGSKSKELFQLMRDHPPTSNNVVHNWIVPYLIHTGHSTTEVLKGVDPQFLSNAAFGCVLSKLAPLKIVDNPDISVPLDEVEQLALDLKAEGHLPINQSIFLSRQLLRRLIQNACIVPTDSIIAPSERLHQMLNILSHSLSTFQLKSVVNQLFEVCLPTSKSSFDSQNASEVCMIVDACIAKDLKFPSNSWFFYYLENCGVGEEKQNLLKIPFIPQSISAEDRKPSSNFQSFIALIEQRNIDEALKFLRSLGDLEGSSATTSKSDMRSNLALRFPDPVAEVYKMIVVDSDRQALYMSANQFEEIFWAAFENNLLTKPLRAIYQIAGYYVKMSDYKGLAKFCAKVADQLSSLQHVLLTPNFMRVLLDDNLAENSTLLKSIICNRDFALTDFVTSACDLTELVKNRMDQLTEPESWDPSSAQYWPVRTLADRFQRISHLQKLRTVHNVIGNLCRMGNVSHAHTMRFWANQLGLVILPQTNELLIMTSYWMNSGEFVKSLPQWCMSHDLSQHFPINLDANCLAELDALLCNADQPDPKDVARWFVHHVDSAPPNSSGPNTNWLPTWLVVCQRLHQSSSKFTVPSSWFNLATEWLKQTTPSRMEPQLQDWFNFAPTQNHRAALTLAALSQPISQSWAVGRLRADPHLLYTILLEFPYESLLNKDQLSEFLKSVAQLSKVDFVEITHALNDPTGANLKALSPKLSDEELLNELVRISTTKISSLSPVVSFLKSNKPDCLTTFFNDLFSELRQMPRSGGLTRALLEEMQSTAVDVNDLSVENQAFVDFVQRPSASTLSSAQSRLSFLESILPANLGRQWLDRVQNALSSQDYATLLDLWNKLDDVKTKQTALTLLTYSVSQPKDGKRIRNFLLAVAEYGDSNLLSSVTRIASPFIPPALSKAYFAVARVFNHEQLNWFDRACVRFHKLGPLLQVKAPTPVKEEKESFNPMDQLLSLVHQPNSQVVEIIRKQENMEKLQQTIVPVISGWSINKKLSLISRLTSEGLTDAVDRILKSNECGFGPIHAVFQPFSEIISSSKTGDSQLTESSAESALRLLSGLDQKDVISSFKGPHVETLFRCWPSEKLDDLQNLMVNTVGRDRTSLLLQLAAVSVNRGHLNIADKLIKKTGPIPTTFLAGSPRYLLTEAEIQNTLAYLTESDPSRVPALFDTCLRNVLSAPDIRQQTDYLSNLLRLMTSEPNSHKLQAICLPATVNLVKEYFSKNRNIPSDIAKHFNAIISGN